MIIDGSKLWPKEVTKGITKQMVHGVENYVYKGRPKTLDEVLRNTVVKYPDKVALILEDTEITYRELDRLVNNHASALINDCGIKKGDRVALLFRNCIEIVISMFGAIRAGAIVLPLNNKLKSAELKFQLENSQTKLLIGNSENWPVLAPIKDEVPCNQYYLLGDSIPGTKPYSALTEKDATDAPTLRRWQHRQMHQSGDVLTGTTALIADYLGIEKLSHVKEKLAEMISVTELVYAAGIAASINSTKSASGTQIPNVIY